MASVGFRMVVVIFVLVCLLTEAPRTVTSAVTCGQVAAYMAPCASYARRGGAVPPGCCRGVRGLNAAATTTQDRRQACACLKSLMANFKGLKPGLISGTPAKCGVRIPYRISPSMDCSNVR